MSDRPYIGGQAVIEGVMMRCPTGLAVAVRRPDGSLVVLDKGIAASSSRLRKWPFVRGVHTLVESMTLGYECLTFSADQQEAGGSPPTSGAGAQRAMWMPMLAADGPVSTGSGGRGAMAVSMLFAVGLFVALPQALTALVLGTTGLNLGVQDFGFHLMTGAFKLAILTAYMVFMGRIPELARVFQYHGAEHKTIFAYEAGLPLTVENVLAQSPLHPRCGTTFLVVVVVLSILVGSIATPLILPNAAGALGQAETLLLRIGLLPIIAALGYELQRLAARFASTGPLRWVNAPGFLFQKLTTREPSADQVEVAILAMETAIRRDREGAGVAERMRSFPTLAAALEAI